jgi:hypothetical protein
MRIRAFYRVPSKKEILVVACYPSAVPDNSTPSGGRILGKEELQHIRNNLNNMLTNKNPKWTIKIVLEDDFLKSILGLEYKTQTKTNQSFDNSEYMELLTINPLKTPRSSIDLSSSTPKALSKVPIEDIIEVFI